MKKILLIALVALSSVTFAQDYLATSNAFFYMAAGADTSTQVNTGCTITVTDERIIKLFWEGNDHVDVFTSMGIMTKDSMFQFMNQDAVVYDVRYRPELNGWMFRKADKSYLFHLVIAKEY